MDRPILVERDRVLRALAEVRRTRLAIASLERSLVASARHSLVTWREIGETLGVTTQSAHRRFRAVDPLSRPRPVDPLKAEVDELHRRLRAESAEAEGSDPSARAEVPGASAKAEVPGPSASAEVPGT